MKTNKLDRRRFRIGDFVRVSAYVKVQRVGRERTLVRFKIANVEIIGQVVGIAVRCEGRIESDIGYSSDPLEPPEDFGNYLDVTERHELWEVKFGLMNRPVFVEDDAIRLAECGAEVRRVLSEELPNLLEIPVLYTPQPPWTKQARDALREEMRGVPRDDSGRWKDKDGDESPRSR